MVSNKLKSMFSKRTSDHHTGVTTPYSTTAASNPSSTSTSLPINTNTNTNTNTLSLDDFDVLKLLGTGASSSVYLGRNKTTSGLVAIKVMKKEGRSNASLESIVREQQIQCKISPESKFASLEASWHDDNNFYLAMTYYPGGDLAFELMRCEKFEASRARFYAAEIVIALENLHKENIIHRDVKPGNILFRADGHIVLADFGMSKMFDKTNEFDPTTLGADVDYISFDVDGDCDSGCFLKGSDGPKCVTNEVCGTPFYMSPEMHYGENYSFDVDYWGMGVTLYRMLTGRMPFGDDAANRNQMAKEIAESPLEFKDDDNIDVITQDFLQGVLAKDPLERLTIEQIKAHPYFTEINWALLSQRKVDAPWKPYVRPSPQTVRTKIPIRKGSAYDATNDPFPQFTFVATRDNANDEAKSDCSALGQRSRLTMASEFIGNVFASRGPKKSPTSSVRSRSRSGRLPFLRSRGSSSPRTSPATSTDSFDIKKTALPDHHPATSIYLSTTSSPKAASEKFEDVKWRVRKMWIPKVRSQTGTRVDLLA